METIEESKRTFISGESYSSEIEETIKQIKEIYTETVFVPTKSGLNIKIESKQKATDEHIIKMKIAKPIWGYICWEDKKIGDSSRFKEDYKTVLTLTGNDSKEDHEIPLEKKVTGLNKIIVSTSYFIEGGKGHSETAVFANTIPQTHKELEKYFRIHFSDGIKWDGVKEEVYHQEVVSDLIKRIAN